MYKVGDEVLVGRCWSYTTPSEPMFIEKHQIKFVYDDGFYQFDGFSCTENSFISSPLSPCAKK